MINKDRIVPVQKTDLLTLYGTTMKLAGTSFTVANATAPGTFTVTGTGDVGNILVSEPVKKLNFASGVTAAVVYFTAGYDYEGFSINGVYEEPAGGSATVNNDLATLYTATLSSGDITIAQKGL